MKSYQIVTCPSDTTTPIVNIAGIGDVRRSYAYANYIRSTPGSNPSWATPAANNPGRTIAAIPAPSLTMLLGERIGQTGNGGTRLQADSYSRFSTIDHMRVMASEGGKNFYDDSSTSTKNVSDDTGGRHLGTNNILFADGHVKAMKFGMPGPLTLPGHSGGWVNSDQDIPQG